MKGRHRRLGQNFHLRQIVDLFTVKLASGKPIPLSRRMGWLGNCQEDEPRSDGGKKGWTEGQAGTR